MLSGPYHVQHCFNEVLSPSELLSQVLPSALSRSNSGHSAEKNDVPRSENRIDLTPPGLLMEGDFTQNLCSGHFEFNFSSIDY
jgi:hypothetical protein